MKLMLLRHGIAEDAHESPDGSDAARRLTPEGVKRTREVVSALAKGIDKPDIILSSPRVRARQTADLAAEAFGCDLREIESLGVGHVREILSAVRQTQQDSVMIVGHEPTFSGMTELICFGRVTGHLEMKKAGLAVIDYLRWRPDGMAEGVLTALVPPAFTAGPR